MQYPDERKLFTVKEVSHACGVSRTTLIRMEESGFLTPFKIDPQTGYRYYDADNLTAIGQYQLLQQLGLSRNEIADVYYRRVDLDAFFREQKAKVARLARLINNLEMRIDHKKNFTTSFIDVPELTCYCVELGGNSTESMETMAYEYYGQCVKKGMRMNGVEPFFVTRGDNWHSGQMLQQEYKMTLNIPVLEELSADPQLRHFPATKAFSMLSFGYFSVLPELCEKFWQEVERRKLVLTGPVRILSLVAPYTGTHIRPEDFCGEMIAPIESL